MTFYGTQAINSFLSSMILSNHDKVEGFQPIMVHYTPLLCLYCKISFKLLKKLNNLFRSESEKLLPNDCLNILCVIRFKGEDHTTSGTTKPTNISTSVGKGSPIALESRNIFRIFYIKITKDNYLFT